MSTASLNNVSNNQRIAKNTVFLYIRMFFALVVTLYTSRVVLRTLGVVDYGVYNIVAGFVSMFAFLNSTLSASIQRFYNFESAREGLDGFRKVYSAGILIHLVVVLVCLVLLETIGLWYVNKVMVVPEDRLFASNLLFQCSVVSLCLLIMSIPYTGAVIASERMDFYALVSILDTVLKLLAVLALPYLPFDKLYTYGALLLFISILNFIAYFLYSKKKIFDFKFKAKYDRLLLRQMLSFSSWNLIGTFAFMLKGQAVNMLLNFFFGPIINAARGIAYQVGNAVTSFSSNITVAFKPQVVSSYSKGDTDRVTYLFTLQSKICFALIAILMIPIVLDIDEILRVWLGNDVPAYTSIFSIIVLIDALICSLNTPCTQVVSATGNIRNFQIASTCVNILLLPVCWLFLYLGFNPITVFVLTAVFSILNQIVCVWQTSRVFNISIPSYCTCVILPCLIFAFLCPIPGYICSLFIDAFILRLSVVVCLTCLWGITLTMLLFLSKSERAQLVFRLKSKFKCTK